VNAAGLWLPVAPPLAAALKSLRSGDRTYLEELRARFETVEPELQAFLPEPGRFERLHREFAELERAFPIVTERPPLFGLPIGVKDIFRVDRFETRAGSRLPPERLAGPQAASVTRLKQAGALVLGKTVTTEFAYFAPGPTRNPHHLGHTPGGSSSGSAAAVAAGLAPLALGTQTIGSIIRPAAFCGTVGFKPSYGRISTEGVIPLAASFDTIGFFTQEVLGAQRVASAWIEDWQATPDGADPALGVPRGPYLDQVSPEGREHFGRVLERLRRANLRVVEVDAMPDHAEIVARHRRAMAAEAAAVHREWFSEFEDRYHPKTAELIRSGEGLDPGSVAEAREGREKLRLELGRLMGEHGIDLWIAPSATGPAPTGLESTGDPAMNLAWTHAGLPTLGLPTGRSADGLPLGTQLIGGWRGDEQLLAHAARLEPILTEAGG
jgi:Asp-tRNA(Asn)/Glu-tRNA(Gln) amidotransferase A subunit family amidase